MRLPRFWRPTPRSHEQLDAGALRRRLLAGFETSVERRARRLGTALGHARVEPQEVLGDDGAGPRYIRALAEARGEISRHDAEAKIAVAAREVAGIPGRLEAAAAQRPQLEANARDVEERVIPVCEQRQSQAEQLVERARAALDALPLLPRGVMGSTRVIVAVALAVAAFDVAVIQQIMGLTSTGGDFVLWGVTIGVPAMILAINHMGGLLIGVLARGMRRHRLLMIAAVAIIAMLLGIFLFIMLIALFRAKAYTSGNDLHPSLVNGELNVNLGLVNPWWMAPLQMVGSGAAMSASAFRAFGDEGRRLRDRIGERRAELADARRALKEARAELEAARAALSRTDALAGRASEQGAKAQSDIERLRAQMAADVGTCEKLGDAAVALLQNHYLMARLRPPREGALQPFANPAAAAVAMVLTGGFAALLGASALIVAIVAPFAGLLLDTLLRTRPRAAPHAPPLAPATEEAS